VLAASVSQSEFSYPMLVPTIMRYADDKRCGLRYLSDKWMMNGIILTIDSWIIFNEYTLFQDCSRHFLTTIWGTDGQPPPEECTLDALLVICRSGGRLASKLKPNSCVYFTRGLIRQRLDSYFPLYC